MADVLIFFRFLQQTEINQRMNTKLFAQVEQAFKIKYFCIGPFANKEKFFVGFNRFFLVICTLVPVAVITNGSQLLLLLSQNQRKKRQESPHNGLLSRPC